MWPVSPQWDAAWRAGGTVVVRAEVWRDGALQTLPDGSSSLLVLGGTVTVDEASKVRRTLSMTVANTDLDPVAASDLLSPFTTDLRVWVGITLSDGSVESAPVGVFRLTSVTRSSVRQALALAGSDYSWVVAQGRFLTPWVTTAGGLVSSEIAAIAQSAVPGLPMLDLTGSRALTSAATWDREPWDAVTQLAQSLGAEPFLAQSGLQLVLRPVPRVSGSPVWSCDAGSPTANLTDVSVGLSSDGVFNAVVAASSGPGAPVSAIAYQTTGPLAWSRVHRPRFYSSPMLTTVEQCQSAASAILARSVAFSRQIAPSAVPNPALDVGDLITVVLPSGAQEQRVVTRITIPLGPGEMALETRVAADVSVAAYASGLS